MPEKTGAPVFLSFMDLSQQELPLTAYFTRGSKEARFRAVPHKKDRPTEDSQSVACPSKRRRCDVRCSAESPSSSTAGQPKPRPTALQLHTPAPSARKRVRSGRLEESPRRTQLSSAGDSVEQNVILPSERSVPEVEFGPTPSKLPQLLRKGAENAVSELSSAPFATPFTERRKKAKPIDIEFRPGLRHSDHEETGFATPQTSRRISEPVHDIDDHSLLARSSYRLPSKPSQVSSRLPDQGDPHVVLSHNQLSALSATSLPCSPVALGLQDGASAPLSFIQSETLDGQPSDGHVAPMIPVPSSQSQYLLHIDATPKRKRCYRRTEHVISSQTQEEASLTLPTPDKPTTIVNLLADVSPGNHTLRGNPQSPRLSCSERKSLRICTLGSTFVGSPISSLVDPSCSFFATKNGSGELSSKSSSPSRCKRLASYHSPSHNIKSPRRSACHDSIENIPPTHIQDSLTEPESDSDMPLVRMKDKLSIIHLPSREANQLSYHSPVPRDARPPTRCGSARGNLSSMGDDSATEAESDTEILRCVAEIGKKPRYNHRFEVPREDTPPVPVISPLVSPTKSCIVTAPSIIGFTQFSIRGTGSGVPGSGASYSSTTGQPRTRSESLPSVVQDFIRMFPGDESYPADFPESLRI